MVAAPLVWPSTRWETIVRAVADAVHRKPWNKGKTVGQKVPFKRKRICAYRVRLHVHAHGAVS